MIFQSKRNKVTLDSGIIYKHAQSEEKAILEAGKLEMLRNAGLRVPRVISVQDALIAMEFIDGITLPDFLESASEPPFHQAQLIVNWLKQFYGAVGHDQTSEIRGDVNGRNFIFFEGSVWGIDFEQEEYGPIEKDIGRLCAFARTYTGIPYGVLDSFASEIEKQAVYILHAKLDAIKAEEALEYEAMKKRRPPKAPPGQE
ncbi:MAG: hypothetical protein FWG30_02025 [Eubacteriaceae bacterium]|nr:hypothetical protein [Eubacteriaceae bacterium]